MLRTKLGRAFAASVLVSCSSADPVPVTPPVEGPTAVPTHDKPSDGPSGPKFACGDAAACYGAGEKANDAKDKAAARTAFEAACQQGHGEGCTEWGSILQNEDGDEARATEIWQKGCEAGSMNSCFNAAEKLRKGKPKDAVPLYAKACKNAGDDEMLAAMACVRGGLHAHDAGELTVAAELAKASCGDKQAGGCDLLGVLLLEGKGGLAKDQEKAAAAFKKGCAAGDDNACENEKKLAASAAGGVDVPGANITMGSITADGFTLNDMKCKTDAGLAALLLGPAVAGAMGKKKAAFDACAPKGADVRLRWTARGGRVTTADASAGDPKIEACVVKVMKSVPAVLEGTCAAGFRASKKK